MRVPFADLRTQYLSIESEVDLALESIFCESSYIGGEDLNKFENRFAEYCNAKYCVGVGNGTDALWISLKMLGIGSGDEVIVPANSFIATAEAVTLAGATVVFCDVDPSRYTIEANLIESKISENTRAIIPVHLYGCPADMDPINRIAKEYALYVVEDAAQAHGAEYKNKKVGRLGDVACFSFYPGKNLGAYGDAGAVVTNNCELADNIRMFSNHGRKNKYDHLFEGVNSRLDTLQAAILNVKLDHLDTWSQSRLANARRYNEMFKGIPEVKTPQIPEDSFHVFHLYVVRVQNRDVVLDNLKQKGIACGVHYPIALPNSMAYQYLGNRPEDFPVASKYQEQVLSLPMYPELKKEDIEYVVEAMKKAIASVGAISMPDPAW